METIDWKWKCGFASALTKATKTVRKSKVRRQRSLHADHMGNAWGEMQKKVQDTESGCPPTHQSKANAILYATSGGGQLLSKIKTLQL